MGKKKVVKRAADQAPPELRAVEHFGRVIVEALFTAINSTVQHHDYQSTRGLAASIVSELKKHQEQHAQIMQSNQFANLERYELREQVLSLKKSLKDSDAEILRLTKENETLGVEAKRLRAVVMAKLKKTKSKRREVKS